MSEEFEVRNGVRQGDPVAVYMNTSGRVIWHPRTSGRYQWTNLVLEYDQRRRNQQVGAFILQNASETWALNKTEQIRLEVWERKILRKLFGGKRTEEGWIRRINEETNNLYGEASIVSVIRPQRLRWVGHIERMTNVRIPKLLMEKTIEGKRRRGRPKARWKAEIEKDLQQLQIREWKEKAKGRTKWRRIVHKAMGLLGSQS
ncbi:hypothetical protein NQ315_014061 [Exocentrus adspersus]|uniref:Uncharacterized protein n=1 Tax=Exocentrus adspersus TaxID=1586481 RepID=A0AAV8VVM8_9CUCU|nr:hypothetical protein NQ315_014061 [Exocentrus adspersus]